MIGIALLVGVLSGSRDILQPLSKINILNADVESVNRRNDGGEDRLIFRRVKSLIELDQYILQSKNKYIMLDFYADWCISCKEMERYTFTDSKVKSRLEDVVLLQVDVTAGTPDDTALLNRFKLFGPPGIIFIDRYGKEVPGAKIIGYQNKEEFLSMLNLILI